MRAAASAVTARRAADSARGLEAFPAPFVNPIDSQPYSYFIYTPFSLIPSAASFHAQPWGCAWSRAPGPTWPRPDLGLPFAGCSCARGVCGGAGCACADAEAVAADPSGAGMRSLSECGDGCACGPSCENRRTQRGVTVRLRVERQLKKGWALHAAEAIHRGQFVCEYAGEFLTTEEARRRHRLYDELALVALLQGQLSVLQTQLFNCRLALASMHPDTAEQLAVLQPAYSAASAPSQMVNYDDLPQAVDFMDVEPQMRGLESLQLSQPPHRDEDESQGDHPNPRHAIILIKDPFIESTFILHAGASHGKIWGIRRGIDLSLDSCTAINFPSIISFPEYF
ncbi:LOW QUALITY PROTEIN: histone-lysine N-methyltransferase SUVR3 [Hordeum vulgare subsp. vulgare]|uniref:LOW QUALITY PROTEIN: histone-lysine N-methyltransferase SUVR3 n=1 Tax=Hordeum vulgare subsp. vulgare TaxID=112509 RepID=UPI001D1A45D5|nr:LOW QUALITY PROTEIN: histone-lysine N-methyltransferase SUVR3 [Hordeum vulgare subsp. vulgare]